MAVEIVARLTIYYVILTSVRTSSSPNDLYYLADIINKNRENLCQEIKRNGYFYRSV